MVFLGVVFAVEMVFTAKMVVSVEAVVTIKGVVNFKAWFLQETSDFGCVATTQLLLE